MSKKIIDVACGSKMFWFDKNNSDVVFCDKRKEKYILCDGRSLEVSPDVQCDFTDLPFADESFYVAAFDPPHLNKSGENSWLCKKYGKLDATWPLMIKSGFYECMRVLKPNGILIFKWNEVQIKTSEIIAVVGKQPLFGHKSGKQQNTHWLCFIKSEQ